MSQVINPYNFIPFSFQSPVRESPEKTYQNSFDLLHGYMDVTLQNTTEMIIPESHEYREDPKDHKHYHFYRLPDEARTPAIPGSTIRGMIRSVYETISNSCTTVLLDHNDYSMRTSPYGAFKKKGVLEHDLKIGTWKLYASEEHVIRLNEIEYNRDLKDCKFRYKGIYKNGHAVSFAGNGMNTRVCQKNEQGCREGWILFNQPVTEPKSYGRTRHYQINITEKTRNVPLKVWNNQEPFRMLDEILDQEKTPKNSRRTKAHDDYWDALKEIRAHGGCVPVWYLPVRRGNETLYYLSNASIGRVHINRTWEEIMGTHSPCKEYKALCPACRLFGTEKDGGFKSRVRFTDATLVLEDQKRAQFGNRTLEILSTPRPSAFEFYIKKPNDRDVRYWNYDYYGTKKGMNLEYRDMQEASPRGRKFYWHGTVSNREVEKSNQNSTMEYINAGNHFSFRVYFDGITKGQLKDLEYAISLGENDENSPLQLKIGHARPLGYGSVKLTIKQVVIRKELMEENRIRTRTENVNVPKKILPPENIDQTILKSLLVMCNINSTKGESVAYPEWTGRNGSFIYEWFSHNRTNDGGWCPLPNPTDVDITLTAGNGVNRMAPPTSALNKGNSLNRTEINHEFSSSRPIQPVKRAVEVNKIKTGDVILRAEVKGQAGKDGVLLKIPENDSPFCDKFVVGKMKISPAEIKRYGKGKQVKVKIVGFSKEDNCYLAKPC